jgi:hypothetical protein
MKNVWIVGLMLFWAGTGFAEDGMETTDEAIAPVLEVVEHEAVAETTPVTVEAEPVVPETTKAPVFAVILPERIDHAWYWILYTDTAQHIVQSAIEKALVRAGVEVIDLNTASLPSVGNDMQQLMSMAFALDAGKQVKADYVVTGQATAIKASEGQAYGVNVFRSQVDIVAKIVRVSDGKIMDIEDASVQEGGQSAQGAGQAGLKKAGTQVASKIARIARELAAGEPSAQ